MRNSFTCSRPGRSTPDTYPGSSSLPGDWDDTPVKVEIPHRRGQVKTGLLPADTTHQLVLIMLDGQRRSLVVIPPGAAENTASKYLGAFGVRRDPASMWSTPSPADT
ncbi:hypothetical protein JCM18899A_42810 [Nocardioides sp. AN3]